MYPHVTPDRYSNGTPTRVNLVALSAYLQQNFNGWNIDRVDDRNVTFKSEKYEIYAAKLRDMEPIGMPELTLVDLVRGPIRVDQGRHRLYAQLDAGYTHALVMLDPNQIAFVRAQGI